MIKPTRIQRKRTKGWRLPPNTKCVTRPGKFGNPCGSAREFHLLLSAIDRDVDVVKCHEYYEPMKRIHDALEELRGFHLACWCKPDQDCHGTVLLEYANR